jgi:glycerophosphoryl diester phosphodiesterase
MEQNQNGILEYKKKNTRVEGHRGAGFLEPENTMPAFLRAIDMKLDGIELDVFVTKDGFPIVVHGTDDYKIEFKDSTKTNYPYEMIYSDFQNLEVLTGGTIPLLADVLQACKNKTWINIELKEEHPRVAEPVVRLVADMGMLDQVVFSSFVHSHREELAKAFKKLGIEKTFSFGYLIWQFEGFPDLKNATEEDSVNIDYGLYLQNKERVLEEINKAREKKMKLKFYVPRSHKETEEDYSIMEKLGTDTIITDYPEQLTMFLSNTSKEFAITN